MLYSLEIVLPESLSLRLPPAVRNPFWQGICFFLSVAVIYSLDVEKRSQLG